MVDPAVVSTIIDNGGIRAESVGLWWSSVLSNTLAIAESVEDADFHTVQVPEPGTYLVLRVES